MSLLWTHLLGYAGAVMAVAGVVIAVRLQVFHPEGTVYERTRSYVAELDADLRFLRHGLTGAKVFQMQVLSCVSLTAIALATNAWLLLLPVLAIVFAPAMVLRRDRNERVERLEAQLDSFMLVLANALQAVPSLGEALASSAALMPAPLSEELDVTLKEYRLGTPLDEALRNLAERVSSPVASTAITTLRVARQTGGDLPSVLRVTAESLREMARLEGVVRTKTAEGRSQAFVISLLPAVMFIMLKFLNPELIQPLFESTMGHVILSGALLLWLGAILSARKILDVDI